MLISRTVRFVMNVVLVYCTLMAVGGQASWGQSAAAGAQASTENEARGELNLGVEAYKAARYEEAIAHFRKAKALDADSHLATIYLGTALAQNVVPGLDMPDNVNTANEAVNLFEQALAVDPHDVNSMKQIAGICFSLKWFEKARDWQKKVLAEDGKDAEAAYTIGVIDWTVAHQNALNALQAAGTTDDGIGNRKAPPSVLETIREENAPLVEEALVYLHQAIENRPVYYDAMAYMNLVYRRKADLDWQDDAARQEDLAQADAWRTKAMEMRKAREQQGARP